MLKYNFLLYLLSPLIFLRLLFYTLKNKENLSYLLKKTVKARVSKNYNIWLHAASVGEMKIAIKISKCLKEKGYSDIVITSNTPSSKHIFESVAMDGIDHHYLPMDFYLITNSFVRSISAKLLIVIETELWPNLYYLCKKHQTKIITVNARFNPPQGITRFISKNVYKNTIDSIEHIYCKSEKDMQSFLEFGNKNRVSNLGNIKHALVDEENYAQRIIDKKYVLLASSHHREEILIIKEWLKLKSNKHLLVIAPRHPERLGDILSDIPLSGINLAIRSKEEKIRSSTQIYIADTLGEMGNLIKYSEFTIFGGSFVDIGGHSFMEAAIQSKAIIVGPYMYNFVEETEEFLKNNALIMCQKPEMLKNIFEKLFRSKSKREIFEKNARSLALSKKSIIDDYISKIEQHIES